RDAPAAGLALRTEAARSPAKDHSLDWLAADGAGLIFAIIDAMQSLESACFAISIHIITQAAATMPNRTSQHELDRAAQALNFIDCQLVRAAQGMNRRLEQRLVGVNVADAGEKTLIEQHILDGTSCARQSLH